MTQHSDRWQTDMEYREHVLRAVSRSGDGYQITDQDGWTLGIDDPGWVPRAGDTARFYGRGIGYPVRGVVIFPKNGGMPLVARYQTAEEQEAEHQRWCEDQKRTRTAEFEAQRETCDRQYAALPPEFRARINRFRAGNAEFRVEHEPYEMFVCEQAVIIAEALRSRGTTTLKDVAAFGRLDWAQQKAIAPALSDEHSGNTFGFAVRLAGWYLTRPENVAKEHGALTPLVCCVAYGCTHEQGERTP